MKETLDVQIRYKHLKLDWRECCCPYIIIIMPEVTVHGLVIQVKF